MKIVSLEIFLKYFFDFLSDYESSLKDDLNGFSSKPSDFYVACVGGELLAIDRIRKFLEVMTK